MRVKLTAGRIREFKCREGKDQDFLWDTDAPWLAVRSTANSAVKTFVFQSRIEKKTLRVRIGGIEAWDIDGARAEARRLQTLIDQGVDPRDQKADQIAEVAAKKDAARRQAETEDTALRKQALIVAGGWQTYIEDRRPHWGERHYRDHVNLAQSGGEPKKRGKGLSVPGPLAPLLALRFVEVTPERIAAWL